MTMATRSGDRTAPVKMTDRLFAAQSGFCPLCGGRLIPNWGGTIDHVIPRSSGGRNWRNRLLAHFGCNVIKSDRMPTGCELIWLDAVNSMLEGNGEISKRILPRALIT